MNLGRMLRQAAAKTPHKTAIICGEQQVTYESFDRSTDALAHWLIAQSLTAGDRVAIHWTNSIETVSLYFACFKAGLVAVPVNNRLKPPEIAYILQHSQSKLCFSEPALAPLCEEIRGDCPDLQRLYTSLPDLSNFSSGELPEVSPDHVAAV